MFGEIGRRLLMLARRRQFDRDLDEEMRLHMALREQRLREAGLPEQEAHIAAQRRFGNPLRLREDSHEAWGWSWLEQLIQDVRYGARSLARTPVYTAMAIAIVALGIGTNTLVFSIAHAVLFRPLPFDAPEELVRVYEVSPDGERTGVAPATFADMRLETQSFSGLAAVTLDGFNLTGSPEPEVVRGAWVSPELFSMLGVRPALGRAFLAGEDRSGRVAMISHGLWKRRFGGDAAVLEKTFTVSSHDRPDEAQTYAIVGVLPEDFWFLRSQFELWLPLVQVPADLTVRESRNRPVVARLRPDVTVAQAAAELDALARRVADRSPKTNAGWSAAVAPLHTQLVQNVRPAFLMLLGAGLFVILVAGANFASLLLVRGVVRERAFAMSMALGAGRARVVRQGVIEALMLALVGCALGLGLTRAALGLVIGMIPPGIQQGMPGGVTSIAIDTAVLLVAAVFALATGVIFGLIPALHSTRVPLNETLKATGHGVMSLVRSRRLRDGLLVAEVALALLLLVGAGMLMQTFVRLQNLPLGFSPDRVLSLRLALPRVSYPTPETQLAFFGQAVDRIRALPGVEAASLVTAPPMRPPGESRFVIDGHADVNAGAVGAREISASPGYFETLAIRVLEGRGIADRDTAASLDVAVISGTMARRYWPDRSPVGQRIRRQDAPSGTDSWSTVVGVVDDVRYALTDRTDPVVYRPYTQQPSSIMSVLVRTAGPPTDSRTAVLNALWGVDRDQPTYDIGTLEQSIASGLAQPRFSLLLMGVFAGLALTLACLGVYELVSYSVSVRTQELGVRMSLGATRGDVLRLVLGSSMKVVLAGIILGAAAAAGLARLLASRVPGLTEPEPHAIAATAMLFAIIALVASYIPARAVSSIDPVRALRAE